MKAFFFSKYSVFSSYFLIFPTLKFFWLSSKKPHEVEKTIIGNNTIWYAFYKKIAAFSDFEENSRFFPIQKTSIFSKETQNSFVLRNLSISVAFFGKYATNWWNKFTFRNVNEHRLTCERSWQTSDKRKKPFERKIFLPCSMFYKYGGK